MCQTVVMPYAEYAADLCGDGLSVYTQSSSILHEDVRFYAVNHLIYESNLRMPVLRNGSDGAHLPAFTNASLVQQHRRSTAARRSGILVMAIPKSTSLAHLSYLYASQPVVDEETLILSLDPNSLQVFTGHPPRRLVALGFDAFFRTSRISDN